MWNRHRFKVPSADYDGPKPFPPPGPSWVTGYAGCDTIVVCYLPPDVSVTDWWPDAHDIDTTPRDEIVFTGRFPRPDWWTGEGREA